MIRPCIHDHDFFMHDEILIVPIISWCDSNAPSKAINNKLIINLLNCGCGAYITPLDESLSTKTALRNREAF
jgi:hypothetical protein